MIKVPRAAEPSSFDVECRRPGNAWLAAAPGRDPRERPLWGAFRADLREAFGRRCGFLAVWLPGGTIDHWVSVSSNRALAYEWSNYRFVDAAVNSAKRPAWEGKLLDPFEVETEWFEILLPSLQLVVAAELDAPLRARIDFTLDKLRLRDGEDVIRLRREWLELYERGELSLQGLHQMAPLIARAVAKRDGLALESA